MTDPYMGLGMPHNNRNRIIHTIDEIHALIRRLERYEEENDSWFRGIDERIDELADLLSLPPISYGKDTQYCRENGIRYNATYRLEMLVEGVRERRKALKNLREAFQGVGEWDD